MDDCFGTHKQLPPPRRLGLHSATRHVHTDSAAAFNDCLNAVHPSVKFTREEEKDSSIAFLDVQLTHLPNSRISIRI
jgi:hypothetical protein